MTVFDHSDLLIPVTCLMLPENLSHKNVVNYSDFGVIWLIVASLYNTKVEFKVKSMLAKQPYFICKYSYGIHLPTVLYPNLCYKEQCCKEVVVYFAPILRE